MKRIEVRMPDNQKLIITQIQKRKVKTDDGMKTCDYVAGVFSKSVELLTDKIEQSIKNEDEDPVLLESWCKEIQNDIHVIGRIATIDIVKTLEIIKFNK